MGQSAIDCPSRTFSAEKRDQFRRYDLVRYLESHDLEQCADTATFPLWARELFADPLDPF